MARDHLALCCLVALASGVGGCPHAPDDDDSQPDDDLGDDDSGDDDDDSAPAFGLPDVPETVDRLCRVTPPMGAVVDWSMSTTWTTPLATSDGELRDTYASAVVVPAPSSGDDDDAPRLLSHYPTWDFGDYPYQGGDTYSSFGGAYLRADATSGPIWSIAFEGAIDAVPPAYYSTLAIGDLNGDGLSAEALLPLMTGNLHPFPSGTWPLALDLDLNGAVLASTEFANVSPPFPLLSGHATTYRPDWTSPVDREFIDGWSLWLERDAIEGEEWAGALRGQSTAAEWLPVDANLDGTLDLPTGVSVLDGRTGAALWTALAFDQPGDETGWSLFPVNADCDAWPEFVALGRVGQFELLLIDHDGSVLWTYVHPFEDFGAILEPRPAFADLDGDRRPEIVVHYFLPWDDAPETEMVALGLDGTPRWVTPLPEVPGVLPRAAPAAFDFDGDGAMEVVAQTIDAVWILDGADGEVLSSVENWNHAAPLQPMIADVAGGGSAEIVVHSRGWGSSTWLEVESSGMRALGPTSGSWAGAPPRWDQAAWQAARWLRGGVETGGMPPFWREHDSLRAQVATYPPPPEDQALPNPQIATAVADRRGCPESVDLWVAIRNTGTAPAGGLTLRVTLDGGVVDIPLSGELSPGQSEWLLIPAVPPQAEPAQAELVGVEEECDACDNTWPVHAACH